jgi:hypothetical protein
LTPQQTAAYCSDPTLPPEDALKTFDSGLAVVDCLKATLEDTQCGPWAVAGGPAGSCNCVKKEAQCSLNQYNSSAGSTGALPSLRTPNSLRQPECTARRRGQVNTRGGINPAEVVIERGCGSQIAGIEARSVVTAPEFKL